ncbi:TIGR04104 family putative zinc finger protein [Alkalibacillus almallahensis]|uniref:TIGR04104 family putative zinc finger protein n=1 Tax=Alkalibacillus almallahensis TaxID=1379154 RepID=UPI00141ECBC9|nr:TIGR04104 family putative zinc finger protein [Alkalibacillus almallahensis]
MPTCQRCFETWTFKDTMKRAFVLDTRLTCPYCDGTQFISKETHRRFGVAGSFVPIPMLLPLLFNISFWWVFVIWALLIPSYFIAYCSLMTFSNEEQNII